MLIRRAKVAFRDQPTASAFIAAAMASGGNLGGKDKLDASSSDSEQEDSVQKRKSSENRPRVPPNTWA